MRNIVWVAALLILFGLTICTPSISVEPTPPVVPPSGTFEKFGPRVDDLIFKVGGTLGTVCWDLDTGVIDLMDYAVPSEKVDDWLSDPSITMGDYSDTGWYEFDINLQMWPTGHGKMDGIEGAEPTNAMDWDFPASWDEGHYWVNYTHCQRCADAKYFRKALAYLTDRDGIDAAFEGTCALMETFIFPVIGGWENPAAPKYSYSLVLANASLNAGGFMDYDGDNVREYCKHVTERNAWLTGGPVPPDVEEIPDIQLWRRTDDPIRSFAGELLRDDLAALEVEVDDNAGSYSTCAPHAWKYYDYHIHTGGWDWTTTPDMYYELWHSSKDIYPQSDGDNYNRYHRQDYDVLAENFKYAPNMTMARTALDACQVMLHDDVACIPLYAWSGYVAHRTYYGDFLEEQRYRGLLWEGFVNELGLGFHSFWTHLNAHPQNYEMGGTLRQGLLDPPYILDPMDSESFSEWLILSRIYESLIKNHPYNVTEKIPWLCRGWTIGTWEFEGKNCTKITFDLKFKNGPFVQHILWHDLERFTAEDVAFTFQYMKDAQAISCYKYVEKLDHVEIIDEYTVSVYYQVQSIWALDWAGSIPIIPKHIWEPIPPTQPGDNTVPGSWAFNPEDEDALIGTGPFMCNKDGVVGRIDRTLDEYFHLEANPTYYRKAVWPDVDGDGRVDLDDFMIVIGQFGTAPPGWRVPWGPIADVNKDGRVDIEDLMEIAVRYGWPWPPPWYLDC